LKKQTVHTSVESIAQSRPGGVKNFVRVAAWFC
jgi:hypothetical protein